MKLYSRSALVAVIAGFTLVTILGMFVFFHMARSMEAQHKAQFVSDTNARLDGIVLHIKELSDHFSAYAELPSFRLIRFNELSLNQAAVREDIRRLELYFLDIQHQQANFQAVRFIGNDGSEVFKVANATIQGGLGDLSQHPETIMAQDLKQGEMRVTYAEHADRNYLTWWLPVYTSLTHRQGILALDIDFDFIKNGVAELRQEGRTYSMVSDKTGRAFLQTAGMPAGIAKTAGDWVVSRDLPLPGLGWRAHIYANPKVFLEDVTIIRRIVSFGLAPLSVLLLLALWRITIMIQAEQKIRHMAHHDTLTGLPNRTLFQDRLYLALVTAMREKTSLALLFLDLDKFKSINDTLGHDIGDLLLKEVANRIKYCIRESDTVARLGGDEFAVLLPAVKTAQNALLMAGKIHRALNQSFELAGHSLHISSSAGIALYPEHASNAELLLKNADTAMYHAKGNGRNNVQLYQPEMTST